MLNNDMSVAQQLLTKAWGETILLVHVSELGGSNRSKVGRYGVKSKSPVHPKTVVIKRVAPMDGETFAPDVAGGPADRLFNEWAGLQLLDELDSAKKLTPKLYGGDRESGVIVIEDMGSGTQLDQLLLGDNAVAAEAGLLALMKSLGQLHAQTIGRADCYEALRDALGPRDPTSTGRVAQMRTQVEAFATAVLGNDWVLDSAEFNTFETFLQPNNPFYAYGHHDPCPDNCLMVDGEMKLLDLEFGGFQHALLDGVYGRIHFPTCWCVNQIPQRIVDKMEHEYRQELMKGCTAAQDDALFAQAVVEACGWHQLTRLPLSLLDEDETWGIATLRQRTVLRLEMFADAANKANHLDSLGELARMLSDTLRQRWSVDMELYPAFRASG